MADKRPYRIWAVYDTETCNKLFPDGNWYAWPVLYIFNDVSACDLLTYEPDDARELVTFLRYEADALAYIDKVVEDAAAQHVIPIICAYNLMFDMQTLMVGLREKYGMAVNAQTATNVYTLDLQRDGVTVLRFWDTFHLEMRGLRAMGEACGAAKLMGDWDYDLVRTPETQLTPEELGYAARDVQVIPAYLRYLCEAHDWLTPDMLGVRVLTKTSLVRQMARHKIGNLRVKRDLKLLKAFEELCRREQPPDFDSYATRLACFRGGLTFTAALTASQVVERVYSLDETSAHHAFINGRRVPVGFHQLAPDVLQMWLDDILRYDLHDVLHRYAYPFQRWFHACVTLDNVRLRAGSCFDAWGIGLLAQAKFNRRVPVSGSAYDNQRAIDGMETVRAIGYVDNASNPTYAYGKLMAADSVTVWVTELEWWAMAQVYEWDTCRAVHGEGTIRSIWPPDYITLQSNLLYLAKDDAKVIARDYRQGEPYTAEIPASVAPGIAEGLRAGTLTETFVRAWYGGAVKGMFNSIYGTQAQNVLKSEYMVRDSDAELVIDPTTRTTDENFDDRQAEQRHPMVLYTYGMRIVGGSRLQLVVAMMLLWEAFGGTVVCTGGDTDSLKVACMPGIDAADLLRALEPLHRATTDAIRLCQARLREHHAGMAADLTGVGCFEVEPATRTCAYYPYHLEAWNKARVSVDDANRMHVTCAGLSRPDGAYTIIDWYDGMRAQGFDARELMPLAMGYNVTITHEVCHALERTRPKYHDTVWCKVTDYLGNECQIDAHQAIALYATNRRLGDLLKYANEDNVRYQRERYGREVSTGEKVVTVDYDYPLALALCGRTWAPAVWRWAVPRLARARLYRQTIDGMEAMRP